MRESYRTTFLLEMDAENRVKRTENKSLTFDLNKLPKDDPVQLNNAIDHNSANKISLRNEGYDILT